VVGSASVGSPLPDDSAHAKRTPPALATAQNTSV
jgi:hypothetical protein